MPFFFVPVRDDERATLPRPRALLPPSRARKPGPGGGGGGTVPSRYNNAAPLAFLYRHDVVYKFYSRFIIMFVSIEFYFLTRGHTIERIPTPGGFAPIDNDGHRRLVLLIIFLLLLPCFCTLLSDACENKIWRVQEWIRVGGPRSRNTPPSNRKTILFLMGTGERIIIVFTSYEIEQFIHTLQGWAS